MATAARKQTNEVHFLVEQVVIGAAAGELHEARVAAKASDLRVDGSEYARTRIVHVV
jgi:hypothetical protein